MSQPIADCSLRYDGTATRLEGSTNVVGASWGVDALILKLGAGLVGDEEVTITVGSENNAGAPPSSVVPSYVLRPASNEVRIVFSANGSPCQSSASVVIARPAARPGLALAGGPTPSSGGPSPSRYDLSVNFARVDGAAGSSPTLITGTGRAAVGAYNGNGAGNKAILAVKGQARPLADLKTIVWQWEDVGAPGAVSVPYVNLIVDLGAGGLAVFSIEANAPPALNLGTLTTLGPGRFQFAHDTAANFVSVVNAFTRVPSFSPPVPIAAGSGPSWPSASFRYADILAAFPGAALVDASSGDKGLPDSTMTPALLFVVGDSTNLSAYAERITSIVVNGTPT